MKQEKNNNISIAIFLPSLRGGGVEKMRLNLARYFIDLGHEVDLVLAECDGPYREYVPTGVNIVDLKAKRVSTCLPGLMKYLQKRRPTALLSAMEHSNIIALLSVKLSRVNTRVVVSTHNTLSITVRKSNRRARLIPFFAKICYPWANGIVAVSKGVADDLSQTLGIARDKITIINNPVITEGIDRLSDDRVTHPWFNEKDIPIILSAGRMKPQKDYPTLLRAFSRVKKIRPARLVILGDGVMRSELEVLADELSITESVSFPGFVKNPYSYMSKSSVFVLSSAWEGFGNVLVEAMAVGTPVVATNCPNGPSEILAEGRYGHLTQVGDSEQMANAIIDTLDKPIGASVLQQRSKEYKYDIIAQHYLELLT
ncbi:MAG: glycosyltransferase [Candidatus Thiodiazotropha sp.]|jgi:glycosyltransferase involved in cell wall biosynthesis